MPSLGTLGFHPIEQPTLLGPGRWLSGLFGQAKGNAGDDHRTCASLDAITSSSASVVVCAGSERIGSQSKGSSFFGLLILGEISHIRIWWQDRVATTLLGFRRQFHLTRPRDVA